MNNKAITMGELKKWKNGKWGRTKYLTNTQITNKEHDKQCKIKQ